MRKASGVALLLVILAAGADVSAQGLVTGVFPTKPLRLIVPFPPGGGNDTLARVVGQQIVVDNRGGAGGVIGATLAAGAAPDGYTLFLGSLGNLAHNPALAKATLGKLNYASAGTGSSLHMTAELFKFPSLILAPLW